MENFSDKVLEAIKKQSIKPRPKWYFFARDFTLWFLVVFVTLLGGVAFSLVLLFLYFQRLGLGHPQPAGDMGWLFVSIPYAWLFVFLLLVGVLYYNLKHLKKNYKYPAYLLIVASLCGSIILGEIAANFGIHRRMNEEFSRRLSFYGPVFDARIPAWGRPGEGVLAGKIGAVNEEFFLLEDFRSQEWKIILRNETEEDESVKIITGQMVMINGQQDSPGVFLADEIFPWDGCHKKCKLVKPEFPRRLLQ
ncbi:MAG: hypothetical protein ACOYMB_03895 [Patescibacteria group bacterium]